MIRAVTLTFCVVVMGCSAAGPTWQSPLQREHPLVGRIWQTSTGRFVAQEELLTALAAADIVLLGEKHDNPDHHALQVRVLQSLIANGRKPALRLEMVTPEQEPKLKAWLAGHPKDAAGLYGVLEWQASGWPDFGMYRPIFEAALAAGLDIGAANLARATVKAMVFQGPGALDAATAERYGLQTPLEAPVQDAMTKEIMASHCNQLPQEAAVAMVMAQRARDAAMADALLQAPPGGAVLIAGNGHVRSDRGVPAHLHRRAPLLRVLAVSFVEVQKEAKEPAEFLGLEGLAADFLWFTPRLDELDPCTTFAEQLKRMKEREAPKAP